jgi:hypothetical protein
MTAWLLRAIMVFARIWWETTNATAQRATKVQLVQTTSTTAILIPVKTESVPIRYMQGEITNPPQNTLTTKYGTTLLKYPPTHLNITFCFT